MIRTVQGLKLGQVHLYDEQLCVIRKFPTRYSVCLDNLNPFPKGAWFQAKISIRDLKGGFYLPHILIDDNLKKP